MIKINSITLYQISISIIKLETFLDAYYITQTLNYNFSICDKMFMVQVIKHFLYKKRKVNQNKTYYQ